MVVAIVGDEMFGVRLGSLTDLEMTTVPVWGDEVVDRHQVSRTIRVILSLFKIITGTSGFLVPIPAWRFPLLSYVAEFQLLLKRDLLTLSSSFLFS